MKKVTLLFTALIFVAALFIASPGFARMNGVMGNGFSSGVLTGGTPTAGCQCQTANLTTEQLATAKAIEDNYADQFAGTQSAIKAKIEEIILLMADDQTTLAQVNSLHAEIYLLKQEYRQLRSSVNQEIATTIGTAYCGCGIEDCQVLGQCGLDCQGLGQGLGQCVLATGNQSCFANIGAVNDNYTCSCSCLNR